MKALKAVLIILLAAAVITAAGFGIYYMPHKVNLQTDSAVMYCPADGECVPVSFSMQGSYARRRGLSPAFNGKITVSGGFDFELCDILVDYPPDDPLYIGFILVDGGEGEVMKTLGAAVMPKERAESFYITFYRDSVENVPEIEKWYLCVGAENAEQAAALIKECNEARK